MRWTRSPDQAGKRLSGLALTNVTPQKLRVVDQVVDRFTFEGGSILDSDVDPDEA